MLRALLIGSFALFSAAAQSRVADLAWMSGHWSGMAGRAQSEELWTDVQAGVMLGLSRTVVKDRLVGFEFLRIETREDGVYYVAQPGGRPPTDFKLTRAASGLAVFENPAHDHPKSITYRLEGTTLIAILEGKKRQEFRFQKTR